MATVAAITAACAVMEPPSGGPEDRTPPRVTATSPADDSVAVGRDARITINFSEKLDEESFKKRVLLFPPVEFERVKASGRVLEIRFKELLPETTFCVLLTAGFKDQHKVASTKSHELYFSTAQALERGEISGLVLFKEKPDSSGVVNLFELRTDTVVDFMRIPPSRISFADRNGEFSFRALPADSSRYLLWGYLDRNNDGTYSGEKEFSLLYPDTINLSTGIEAASEIRIKVIDPNEPAVLTGRVLNETGFDLPAALRLERLLQGEKSVFTLADTTGGFRAAGIPPGSYLLTAFIDIEPDSVCGEYFQPEDSTVLMKEPRYDYPDTLVFEPGEAKKIDDIHLGGGEK